jgi:D-alanyl-D-alanine carboxypeptidase (penicillin-binding protein 5/6)
MPAAPSADDRRHGSRSDVSRDPRHVGRGPRPSRRQWLLPLTFSVLAALVLAAGALAAVRVLGTPPPPRLDLRVPATLAVAPGSAPAIPLPATGSFALESTAQGRLAAVAPTTVLPIGSIAKVMTALVVLQHQPLIGDAPGPTYTITYQDVDFYYQMVDEDGSSLSVVSGEQFTERQLLLALLLPSADNIAETLAVWVAGSQSAFVTDLNAEARALGLTQTSFADVSGLSPQTVSTAADLVKLGQAALANPTLAALVATQSAVMPDGSSIQNLDTDLTTAPGWLGIKTGSTPQAGGCLLFAAHHPGPLGGSREVTVVGAVLGVVTADGDLGEELAGALNAAAAAVKAAFGAYRTVDLGKLALPVLSGALRSAWGTSTPLQAIFESGTSSVEFRVGATLRLSAKMIPIHNASTVGAGTLVARVTARLGGITVATWEVSATGALGQPGWQWLLTH